MSDKQCQYYGPFKEKTVAGIVGKLSHRLVIFIDQKLKDVYLSSGQKTVSWRA